MWKGSLSFPFALVRHFPNRSPITGYFPSIFIGLGLWIPEVPGSLQLNGGGIYWSYFTPILGSSGNSKDGLEDDFPLPGVSCQVPAANPLFCQGFNQPFLGNPWELKIPPKELKSKPIRVLFHGYGHYSAMVEAEDKWKIPTQGDSYVSWLLSAW